MIRPAAARSRGSQALDSAARALSNLSGLLVVLAVGIAGAAALGAVTVIGGTSSYALVVEAGAFVIAIILSVSLRWFSIVALWCTLAAVSSLQLSSTSTHLVGPFGPADALVGLLALAWAWRAFWQTPILRSPLATPGWVAVALCALFSTLLGFAHGFDAHDVLVGVRVILYLVIGYGAARSLTDAHRDARAICRVFWVVLLLFVLAQIAATNATFGQFQALGGQLQTYRDIGSPFFAGKYGLLLAAVTIIESPGKVAWLALISLLAGLAAVLVSLVRTDWLAAAISLTAVALLARRGRGIKLVGALAVVAPIVTLGLLSLGPGSLILNAAQSRLGLLLQGAPSSTDTVTIRLSESQTAIGGLQTPGDWLFGRGFGYIQTGGTYPFQHDSFVWLLTTQGILGMTLFSVVVLIIPLTRALIASRRMSGPGGRLLLALLAAHVANLAEGMISGHLTFGLYTAAIGMTVAWMDQLSSAPDTNSAEGLSSTNSFTTSTRSTLPRAPLRGAP